MGEELLGLTQWPSVFHCPPLLCLGQPSRTHRLSGEGFKTHCSAIIPYLSLQMHAEQ